MNSNVNPKRYIGARYVPVFTELPNTEWQAGYSYERLTIVLYNNNSYTSRKNVPPTIGNPEENKEYWVLTGNYNAKEQQIENNLNTEIENRKNADKMFVTQVADNIVENNEAGYDSHTLNKTLASGSISNIGTIYIAKKQITDIALDSTGNNLIIKFVDQNGIETEKTISIKEAA